MNVVYLGVNDVEPVVGNPADGVIATNQRVALQKLVKHLLKKWEEVGGKREMACQQLEKYTYLNPEK